MGVSVKGTMANKASSYRLPIRLLCMIAIALLLLLPQVVLADTSNSTTSADDDNSRTIYVEGYITESSMSGGTAMSLPIPNAMIYFIKNNEIVNQTKSDTVGFYSVVITSGTYSVVTAAAGYQTSMTEETFQGTMTLDQVLKQIPYNGLVPYALNPIIETSPGRPVAVTIVVENSQLVDQYMTFTSNVPGKPGEWTSWFPDGESILVRSGSEGRIQIMFQYNGDQKGPIVAHVIVNGGPFYADIPVVIIVKDMPYESIDLYSNAPQKVVKPGTTTNFVFNVNNKYAQGKTLLVNISKPDGWGASTLNGSIFYTYEGQIASSNLWVYVPEDAAPGYYYVNVTLQGQDTMSNMLQFQVQVQGTTPYDALIKGYTNKSDEGYPVINLTDGDSIDIPVRVYNNGDFPLQIYAYAEVGDNWDYYVSGMPFGKITIDPGSAGEFVVKSKVPNGTYGNYSAKISLEGSSQDQSGNEDLTLIAQLDIKPKQEQKLGDTSLLTLLLAGATAGTIGIALLRTSTKKRRRF